MTFNRNACPAGIRRTCFLVSTLLLTASLLRADVLVWDANNGADGAQDGTGTWTAGAPNWFNQTQTLQNQSWLNGSDAVFGSGSGTAGTITLSGPITAGNLTFSAATSGSYTLGGSGVLTLTNSTITSNVAAAINAVLAGDTAWSKSGAGQLTLGGSLSNTHTGTIAVSAGRLHLSKTGSARALAGNVDISGGGSVTFLAATNQIAPTAHVTVSGLDSDFNGTAPNSAETATVTQTLASLTMNGGTFNAGANSVWNIGSVSYVAGTNRVFVGNSGSVQTYGSLSLVGMNGGASSTAVANGFTLFGNGGPIRTSLTIGAGGLYMENSRIHLGTGTSGSQLVLNGDVSTGGAAASSIEHVTGGAVTAFVSLSGSAGVVQRTFNIASGANLTIGARITNGAATAASLIKTGAGVLIISGSEVSTYTGTTQVNAGVLRAADAVGLPTGSALLLNGGVFESSAASFTRVLGSAAGQVSLTGGVSGFSAFGTTVSVNLGGVGETVQWGGTSFNPTALVLNAASATAALSFVNGIDLNGTTRTLRTEANTATISGVISNSVIGSPAGIIKEGAGTLVLGGATANTYDGVTTINAGTLRLNKTAGVNAVADNILVNTGGTLQLSTNHQIADTAGITFDGGTMTGWATDETIAFLTQNSGGLTAGGNTGHVTITGALTLAGGSTLVINSNSGSANPASWNVGSAILSGADILIGGSNGAGNPRTSLTIGPGGLTMIGRSITLNVGDAGTILNLNGDITGIGTNNIVASGTTPVEPLLEIGAASRIFNVLSGTTTVSVIVSGAGGSLVKTGAGLLQLTGASTYTGATTASGGTFSVAGVNGRLTGTSGITVNNGGIFQNGSPTTANNNDIANRINTAATLTLGGGTFNHISAAVGAHTQDLDSLTISDGANTVNVTATVGTTSTLTFTGASPYTRTGGAVNFVQNPADGGSIIFTNAPSGAGNMSGGLLVGATLNGTDLIAAQVGVLTAFTGWTPTGTDTWTNNASMDVTESNPTAYATETINALRFNTAAALTLTLDGTHTIASDMLLVTPTVGANLSTITGGELRGSAGGDLIVAQFNTASVFEIASSIVDNTTATGLIKTGAGWLALSGANTYTGVTRVNEGVLRAADGIGLSAGSALVLNGGVFQSSAATFSRALGSGAGEVSLTGGTTGFSAASTAVAVNLGGSGATVQWGSPFFNPGVLVLNTTGAAAALDFQNGLDLNGATRIIRVDANTATISGLISNSVGGSPASIVKIGSGVLRLTQANTFDDSVTISGGAIAIGNNGALGAADVIMSGGTLQADGAARTLANNLFLTATSGLGGTHTLSLTGVISGTGALNKSGTSVVQLSGVNTHTGTTNVSNGILRLLTNTALGATSGGTTASGNGTVELANGVVITGETITISSTFGHAGSDGSPTSSRGALQAGVNATAEWAGNIIIGGNQARIGVQEGGTLILSGDITDGANSFLLRLSGELTGTGGVILTGTNNTWDGGTDIVRGTVILGAHNTLPTTTVLDIHFSTNNSEYAGVNMNGFNQTIASLRNGGSTGANAEITNKSRTLATLTVNETGTATYGGIITGHLALVTNGVGTMILTQSNSHTGGTTVNEGILRIGHSGALAGGNVTINGGATTGGLLDLNNLSPTINSLNGAAGAVSAIIANESTVNALRTLTVGVNHGSGSFAGNIVDNTGGLALGRVALTKIGAGTQTLSGTNTYTGDTLINNGTLIADFATGTALNSTSAIKMQGGTLVISNATTATIGNISLTQTGTDFTSGVLKIEDGATITTGTFTGAGFVPFLIDLSGGGTLVANALSVAAVTNGVLTQGGSNRSTIYVRDNGGIGFATRNGSNQIVRYTAATTLTASNTSATGVVNYIVGADLTRTAGLGFHTLQIDTAGGDVTLNMGSGDMTVGNTGRGVLISGTNDATITGSGAVIGGSVFFANYSTGTATIDISLSGQAVISAGTGLTTYTKSANMADLYVAGGVFRMEGADRDFNTGTLRIYGGGVLEIGADLNGAADGAFTRGVAQSAGNVSIIGNGGFSAHGADRVVALGGTTSPAALTWGASDFLTGPGGDNNYTFMLGSASSTHTLEFQNAINLGTRDRRIELADGTSATNVDGRLTGVLSGTGGSVIKEGTGRLEFTAANTYTGRTDVNAGSLLIASTGKTGTGAVTVAANAALMGAGTVQGSSFTLAANGSLHAGNGGTTADIGTLTFQTSGQAVYDLQSGSTVFLDIQNASNHGSIDATFGGNAVGSAGYNAFVDAFSGVGAGTHDLLVFDAAAGSTLTFSGVITVRPEGFTAENGQIFNLLDWTSLVSADFSGFDVGTNFRTGAADDLLQFDLPELTGGLIWDISRFTTSGVIVVVPEPGRALLLLIGLLPLALRRRRR